MLPWLQVLPTTKALISPPKQQVKCEHKYTYTCELFTGHRKHHLSKTVCSTEPKKLWSINENKLAHSFAIMREVWECEAGEIKAIRGRSSGAERPRGVFTNLHNNNGLEGIRLPDSEPWAFTPELETPWTAGTPLNPRRLFYCLPSHQQHLY